MNYYFGPLPREYCVWYYFMSILGGISVIFAVLGLLGYIIMNYKKLNPTLITQLALALFQSFLVYFTSRLLHTMCIKSI